MAKQTEHQKRNLIILGLIALALVIAFFPFGHIADVMHGTFDSGRGYLGRVLVTANITSSFSPSFDHNFTNQTIYENTPFVYDVNCSDPDPLDIQNYTTNSTVFTINHTSGIFNWTPSNSEVGQNSFEINCTSGDTVLSAVLPIYVIDVNQAPVLDAIGEQTAEEGVVYTIQLNATDPDEDNLTYGVNHTIIDLDNDTGYYSFTPVLGDVGVYTLNYTVFDGFIYDYEVVTFTIIRAPYCGDSGCSGVEDCSNCPGDCGVCPASGGGGGDGDGDGSGGGGGSGSGSGSSGSGSGSGAGLGGSGRSITSGAAAFGACSEKWGCTEWNDCNLQGIQSRKCFDQGLCGTTKFKPEEQRECVYVPLCYDGVQNGIETGVDCGGNCPACDVAPPTCTDGVQNGDEEGVDCGGSCAPCTDSVFAKLPDLEAARIVEIIKKQFPWWLVLIVCILLILLLSTDQVYIHYLRKSEFHKYRKHYRRYKPKRIKLYKFVVHAISLTFIVSMYIYWASDDFTKFFKYLWLLILLFILVPFLVGVIFWRLEYREYRKIKKQEKIQQLYRMNQWNLVTIEDSTLIKIEDKYLSKAKTLLNREDIKKNKHVHEMFSMLTEMIEPLTVARKQKAKALEVDPEHRKELAGLIVDHDLLQMAIEFPEFADILDAAKKVNEALEKKKDIVLLGDDIVTNVEDVSNDSYLMTVCQSEERLVNLYNTIVDVYFVFKDFFTKHKTMDKDLMIKEKNFTSKIDGLAEDSVFTDALAEDAKAADAYNLLIDLYNHYQKRIELISEVGSLT